jgi:hypothetical protein
VDKQTALNAAHQKIAAFPSRLSAAHTSGYSAGVADEDTRYAGCYGTAYQNGYLKGWDAAVAELNTAGSVQGGQGDVWYDAAVRLRARLHESRLNGKDDRPAWRSRFPNTSPASSRRNPGSGSCRSLAETHTLLNLLADPVVSLARA